MEYHRVLTVYLGSDTKKTRSNQWYITALHSLLHERLRPSEQLYFASDRKRIESYLAETFDTHRNHGIIFFSSGKKLFHVLEIHDAIEPFVDISDRPILRPLLFFAGKPRYVFILIDRKKAVFSLVDGNEVQKQEKIINSEVPQEGSAKKTDYGKNNKIFRQSEDHLHRHFQLIAEGVTTFIQNERIDFVVLAGHKELFSKFRRHLPTSLQGKIRLEFVTGMKQSFQSIFEMCQTLLITKNEEDNVKKYYHALSP